MESFLKSENISFEKFCSAVRQELDGAKSRNKGTSTFAFMLLSTLEFDSFCELMHGVKEGRGVVFCPPLVDLVDDNGIDGAVHKSDRAGATCAQCKEYDWIARDHKNHK